MKNGASALIVAEPTRIRDGLRALLKAVPQIEGVGQVDDVSSALNIIQNDPPALVLLNSNLSGNPVQTILRQIKLECPQIRCIVLADNVRQQRIAITSGADDVLLAGFSAVRLFTTIERLLNGQKASTT